MNSDKLKNIISKKALGNSDISQKLFQLFYFERVLERLSKSKYRGHIILKGGLLLTSIIGEDERTTKDMDTSLKGIPLTENEIEKIFTEILNIPINDGVSFKIISIKDIRLEDKYGGFRLNVLSKLGNNRTYITIEITTGDIITPREIKYTYNSAFEDKKFPIMAYSIETIIAEKFHTIITRGLLNTRLKDFYDIYILINVKFSEIDKNVLLTAIQNTFKHRKTIIDNYNFDEIIDDLISDQHIKELWKQYQLKNPYAKDIPFGATIDAVKVIIELLEPINV